jgi:lysophospholipase L1-like esterase
MRRIADLAALVASCALCFGLLELGLWIGGYEPRYQGRNLMVVPSENPRLIYEYRPNHRVVAGGVVVETNSDGFRDAEFAQAKREGVFRIIIVGDSVTFGMGETTPYPQHLRELLSRAYGPRFEVFNMSVVGYNSIQEAELVRSKALRFDPDLLIVGYVLNDNKEDGGDGGLSRYFKQSGSRAYDWLRKSAKRLRRHLGKDVTTEAFEELAALAAERRLPVVVVIFPRFALEKDGSYRKQALHDEVRALSERLGFQVFDLLDVLPRDHLAELSEDALHPNAKGHEVVARELLAFLERDGELPVQNATASHRRDEREVHPPE